MKNFPKVLALAVFGPWALFFLLMGAAHADTCEMVNDASGVVWNPADKSSDISLSNGGFTASTSVSAWRSVRASAGRSSGKYYFEIYLNAQGGSAIGTMVGVANASASLSTYFSGSGNDGWMYTADGWRQSGPTSSPYAATYGAGDLISVAVDMDAHKIWFAKNGTWLAGGNPAAGTGEVFSTISGTLYPGVSLNSIGSVTTVTATFLGGSFVYTRPTGFLPWEGVGVLTCTGKYICSAATSSSCSSWVEAGGDNIETFEAIGLDSNSMLAAFGGGLGLTLAFVAIGLGLGSGAKIINSVLGGRGGA